MERCESQPATNFVRKVCDKCQLEQLDDNKLQLNAVFHVFNRALPRQQHSNNHNLALNIALQNGAQTRYFR
jgi:hypothetical protein